jgi:hypothetical protein
VSEFTAKQSPISHSHNAQMLEKVFSRRQALDPEALRARERVLVALGAAAQADLESTRRVFSASAVQMLAL